MKIQKLNASIAVDDPAGDANIRGWYLINVDIRDGKKGKYFPSISPILFPKLLVSNIFRMPESSVEKKKT